MSTPQDNGPDAGEQDPAELSPLEQALEREPEPDPEPSPAAEGKPTRVAVRYEPEHDDGEVSLPGYISPDPAIVRKGDVTVIDATYLDDVTASGRFVEAPDYDAAAVKAARYDKLTKAEIGEHLGLSDAAVADATKPELVDAAVAAEKSNPQPPGTAGDLLEESDR